MQVVVFPFPYKISDSLILGDSFAPKGRRITHLKTDCHNNIGLTLLRFVRFNPRIYELYKLIEDSLRMALMLDRLTGGILETFRHTF